MDEQQREKASKKTMQINETCHRGPEQRKCVCGLIYRRLSHVDQNHLEKQKLLE